MLMLQECIVGNLAASGIVYDLHACSGVLTSNNTHVNVAS